MPKHFLTVPHHKQKTESDCLAACASMCLAYLGLTPPYPQLTKWLDITPWGTPHRHIRHLTQHLPVQVHHQQGSLADLFANLDNNHPVMVFVWTGDLPYWLIETWHAVILVGYDQRSFFVHDPVMMDFPQMVSHGDLDLAWLAHDTYYAFMALNE